MPWNQKRYQQQVAKQPKRKVTLFHILLGCVIVGTIASLCLILSDKSKEVQRKEGITSVRKPKPKKAKPVVSRKNQEPSKAKESTSKKPVEKKKDMWMGREIVSTKVVTNGNDLIITRIDTEGKKHKEFTTIQKRLFKHPIDITLAILLTTPEGALTPPLPPLGSRADDQFLKALRTPIEISEDDSPEDKRIKELVIAAREQMLEELGNGKSVNEVIEEHCTFADSNNRFRAEAMVQYKELYNSGDEAMAEEFRTKANQMISEKGGAPLKSISEIRESRKSKFKQR